MNFSGIMGEYYISVVMIKGVAFKCEGPLELSQVVKLGRELDSRGYGFHIDEKIADFKYERRTLQELEQMLKDS